MHDLYAEMVCRYRERDTPWNQPLPPPEIMALTATLQPGRAIDLGCDTGRTAIYLARHGWDCDGVDFGPEANRTGMCSGAGSCRSYPLLRHLGNVDFLQDQYDLAVDIGCLHAQRGDDLFAYTGELSRLLRPGGDYLLFVRLLAQPDQEVRVASRCTDCAHCSSRPSLSIMSSVEAPIPEAAHDLPPGCGCGDGSCKHHRRVQPRTCRSRLHVPIMSRSTGTTKRLAYA
jgi:SAM-dependent methyltransferase